MKVIYHPEVEEKIRSLPDEDRARVVKVIDLFSDYKFRLTQIYLKKITKDIWELRGGRYRLLFGIIDRNIIVVTMFRKQTQRTPIREIKLAVRRFKDYEI
ncbi:hypothetical protein A3A54_02805 [Candidatus Curtissbacteria bacterium RIFCSPLOWO2_01_FULL_39_62]|uniref:Addiction module toxin RelE n=2 Tax=Candidatus Curtissiibacteriota TaxID=1752717 RepID=A0A1F5G9Z0_9BACT|nr:MAG: hypothetical protein US98_C0040G0003 [Parcubacteria group bacterium GW2011_GWC1_38_6]OGD83261.1 MAG: hypothetical protein A2775_02160 [Candidatus Curtissbacteria bacterium RIFCSPHIGHO2_01_FULL_39_57]OGD88645.1 MAG: hypothetical protein A3D04_00240 [Candidatus Curtissbacteria bacterium RIFCSPHIGHO2_02_FULL_40_16b]OGD90766.1 MAG: hypothetical protein A3E11_01515 [Candidatus Curtissbacteria bacterium RIFCSPHIGHO2_12_FULL_38_37]OGD99468.1 MAG: hypothetical protein A3J17_01740 [Candidatus Cu